MSAASRVMMMIARGVLRLVNDATPLQTVEIGLMQDEIKRDVERVQEFGFSSVPPAGGDVVAVFVGGNRDHGIVIALDHRDHRPKDLKDGEVIVYDTRGQSVKLGEDGIAVTSPIKVTIEAPEVEINAPIVSIDGELSVTGDVSSDAVSLRDHVHPENDGGGPTDPPQGA